MPDMNDITLITGNAGKVAELSRLLGIKVHNQKVALTEIQALDVRRVVEFKAQAAFEVLKRPVLVDDTGLYIEAWQGLPGALVAWFMDSVGKDGILKMLEGWADRSARAVTALGYCDERGVHIFDGELKGGIPTEVRGANGFGFDPIFVPERSQQTLAEMEGHEKDAISSRGIAARKLRDFLSERRPAA